MTQSVVAVPLCVSVCNLDVCVFERETDEDRNKEKSCEWSPTERYLLIT